MADYKTLKGTTIQTLASDLAANAANEGVTWYNSTTGVYKVVVDTGGDSYAVQTITTS